MPKRLHKSLMIYRNALRETMLSALFIPKKQALPRATVRTLLQRLPLRISKIQNAKDIKHWKMYKLNTNGDDVEI